MGAKQELEKTALELLGKGLGALLKTAEDYSFVNEKGAIRAAATFNIIPDHPFRVEFAKGPAGVTLKFPKVKVVPGQAKRKSPQTR
jgi:hypothetical protein